jgi:hypothetical protein
VGCHQKASANAIAPVISVASSSVRDQRGCEPRRWQRGDPWLEGGCGISPRLPSPQRPNSIPRPEPHSLPVIGYVNTRSDEAITNHPRAFRQSFFTFADTMG